MIVKQIFKYWRVMPGLNHVIKHDFAVTNCRWFVIVISFLQEIDELLMINLLLSFVANFLGLLKNYFKIFFIFENLILVQIEC